MAPEECRRLGKLLTEIGKRTADLGVPLGTIKTRNRAALRHLAEILDEEVTS